MSTRVHPSDPGRRARRGSSSPAAASPSSEQQQQQRPVPPQPPAVYTVWKRSSMGFQGTDGFCVYDAAGALAFRVDNYSRRRKLSAGELLLMDGRGKPLLSLRPQLLSLHDRWNCYTAATEESLDVDKKPSPAPQQQLFTMSRCSALQSSDDAEVYMSSSSSRAGDGGAASSSSGGLIGCKHPQAAAAPGYRVEGSFSRRSCKIRRGGDGKEAARIVRKKAGVASRPVATLGDDVFSLVVRPGVDVATIMAIVVVMDRICRRPYTPMVCSSSSQ